MEFDFRLIVVSFIFFGGVKAIEAAIEWIKRMADLPKWALGLIPVGFGLLINVGGIAALGYFSSHGIIAIVASIIMGFIAGFAAMGLYDDRSV